MIEWAALPSIISLIIAVLAFYFARKKENSDNTAQNMEVIVELRTVRRDLGELKSDIQAMRVEWREDHDKIVSMERDINAMWKHIDKLKEPATKGE